MGGDHNRNFAGDVHADAGIWSPPSSAANFCEEDYVITKYAAEFINSLSNLAYGTADLAHLFLETLLTMTTTVYLACRPWASGKQRMDLMSISLCAVGVGSFVFHATLRQTCQYGDDLSMLLLAASLLQRLCCTGQSSTTDNMITTAIYTTTSIMSAYYVRTGNLIVHESMFAGMLLVTGLRTMYLMYQSPAADQVKSRQQRKFIAAVAYLGVGFLLWNIDNEFCAQLRRLRDQVGLPWAWVLELHGWWHILTALGAAVYMELIRELRQ